MKKVEAEVQSLQWLPSLQKKQSMFSNMFGLKWLLLLIPLIYTILLLYFPMVGVLKLSLYNENGFTLTYFKEIFSTTLYMKVLWITIKTSFIVTIMALIISYPIAYVLVSVNSSVWKKLMMGIVMLSLWISLLVRTFTWTVILQEHGIINTFLIKMGLIHQPLHLIYNDIGVVIGMTHILVPYMILSLYSVMEGIDRRLLQAAQGLGAKPLASFFQIFFPLSLPGILSGSLIVFVLAIGYFVTPSLLGGQENIMISKVIQEHIQTTLNWNMASALSVVLLITMLLLLGLSYWVTSKFTVVTKGGSK